MKQLTYQEAYNKIIDAYFKDEIKPMSCNFCFCGTLAPDYLWGSEYRFNEYPYTVSEYRKMETALLNTLNAIKVGENSQGTTWSMCHNLGWEQSPYYEDLLFKGMCKALDVLKQIHRDRGEDVDGIQTVFTKRVLQTV